MVGRITGLAAALFLVGCGKAADRRAGGQAVGAAAPPPGAARSSPAPAGAPERPIALFLGTSLTAGLGLDPDSAYPAIIGRRADSLHLGWHVMNAGVSGETSAGALRRLPWLLRGPVKLLFLETGANDGLRGLDPDSTRANIAAIIRQARAYDSTMTIVLAGMMAPPNFGRAYTGRFAAIYPEVARREHVRLMPFLLAGVAGIDSLNQADGIHPTARGDRIVANNVWRLVGPLLGAGGAAPRR